ncbi:MAG: zinc ribbon domain-containing protein [Eubacterium sp.]|nr:zinc ribbon domain-containing protein [Eubacterium sp.]
MFCSNCGKNIDDGSLFCTFCGKAVQVTYSEMQPESQKSNNSQQINNSSQPNIPSPNSSRQSLSKLPGSQKNINEYKFNDQVQNNNSYSNINSNSIDNNTEAIPYLNTVNNKRKGSKLITAAIILGSISFIAVFSLLTVFIVKTYKAGKEKDNTIESKIDEDKDNNISSNEEEISSVSDAASNTDSASKTKDGEGESTEAQTEESTEVIIADQDTINKSYEAYLNILVEHKVGINNYTWQMGYNAGESYPVSFKDLNEDGIEDLIFMEAIDGAQAILNIYIYENGNAVEAYKSEGLDVEVAGGTIFYVADLKTKGKLLIFNQVTDEGSDGFYNELEMDNLGKYVSINKYGKFTYPNEDYTQTIIDYEKNGSPYDEDTFNKEVNGLIDDIDVLLSHSEIEGIDDITAKYMTTYMSFNDAITKVSANSEQDINELLKDKLPVNENMSFDFASGAGGWSTWLVMDENGYFHGNYHDSDMGITGDGYPNGTIYYSNFDGIFKNISQVDDYTYKMELDYYNTDQIVGTDELYEDFLYIYTEPYGIEGGSTFYLYLPGKPISELSEDALSWAYGVVGDISGGEKLEYYCLYNYETGQAFFNYSE